MSPAVISPLSEVKGLLFDVFGTVVDWRLTVTDELYLRATRKSSSDELPAELLARVRSLKKEDWAAFAQEWRNTYAAFTRGFNPETDPWKTVDEHHRDSLVELLKKWGVEGLFSDGEIESMSLVWHRLEPWADSSEGLAKLGSKRTISTLSNGNTALLKDLNDFGDLGFHKLLSAETFGAYKPNPATYLGGARELGLEPHQVAMVAAHLGDLKSARSHGLRTIYVERPEEETWNPNEKQYEEAKQWVDLWVSQEEDGFLAVARKLPGPE